MLWRIGSSFLWCCLLAATINCETFACVNAKLIERYQLNTQIYRNCSHLIDSKIMWHKREKRRVDATFRGHPKSRGEILAGKFHMDSYNFEQTNSLVKLINKIAVEYLAKCPPVIYYDSFVEKSDGLILQNLLKTFPITFFHGEINERYEPINKNFLSHIDSSCKSYILFLSDPLMTRQIIGAQPESRVVLIARSTQWKLRDFLASEKSSNIVNLLVIGESLTADPLRERPYVLYTHKLYADGLGSNTPIVLTSWIKGALSRPHINLFPEKFSAGFAGHRFQVLAANQPPFIFRLKSLNSGGNMDVRWEGVEYRLLNMIAKKLNFSIDILEAGRQPGTNSDFDAIQFKIVRRLADIGMAGVYVTEERMKDTDMSVGHSRDCAAFITLASKALPKYRAIMGPFQWPVWVALTFVYLGGIFPIVYSDRMTLSHLIGNWGEIENMFWYVFGMFTNSFTFSGKYSWTNSTKVSTRILIGSYWLFTIIITACYTGSIIAFVTLPAFPDTVDSVTDLLGLFFRVATLDNGGWEGWFQNSTHENTAKLYKKMEFVSTLNEGIGNVTQSFFWNYAFLGSKAQLEYLVQSNFSDDNISRRSALHLSEDCFALFQIGYLFPRDVVYKEKINNFILLSQQSGLLTKISNEVSWVMQRSASGKLLQASSSSGIRERIQEERQLTTADTEGMFLLMGIGYLLGAIALISEIVGGITNKCRQIIKRNKRRFSNITSSSRSSDCIDRNSAEQKLYDRRKAVKRAKANQAAEDSKKHMGFGMREFNLTKTTLKELYGNYYKNEPNYILQDGKLILETEARVISDDSTGFNSRDSSAELPFPKMKSMVVAEVDVNYINRHKTTADNDNDHETNDDCDEGMIAHSLMYFDDCLAEYNVDETNETDSGKVIIESKPIAKNELFGKHLKDTTENSFEDKEPLNTVINEHI